MMDKLHASVGNMEVRGLIRGLRVCSNMNEVGEQHVELLAEKGLVFRNTQFMNRSLHG